MDFNILVSGEYILLEPSGDLISNQVYTVTLMPGISGYGIDGTYTLDSEYSFWFTSLYCPLFSTVTKIRLEAGPAADIVADDTIYRMIYKNSLDIVDIINSAKGTTYAYDAWGCTWHNVPIGLRRYVECKTAFDLLTLVQTLSSGSAAGGLSQTKSLGDLSIKYGTPSGSSAGTAADPSKKKQLYDCFMEVLKSVQTSGITAAVRGYYDESKGFAHPVREPEHNRIVRPVSFANAQPNGPWVRGAPWRGYTYGRGDCL